MTVDEELSVLEDQVRPLKVEYNAYFGVGWADEWKVKNLPKKCADGSRMTSAAFPLPIGSNSAMVLEFITPVDSRTGRST